MDIEKYSLGLQNKIKAFLEEAKNIKFYDMTTFDKEESYIKFCELIELIIMEDWFDSFATVTDTEEGRFIFTKSTQESKFKLPSETSKTNFNFLSPDVRIKRILNCGLEESL